jgi:purine-binding chemotaxis protein CheW
MANTYLTFSILNDLYAIDIIRVLEVLEKQELTRVPDAPPVIQGLINFRGHIVPVYESRLKFNLQQRLPTDNYVTIILELWVDDHRYYVGAMVDKVNNVLEIEDVEIKQVPPMSKEFNPEFIKGIVKLEHQFLMIFDIDKIYSSSEIEKIRDINNTINI